MSGIGGIGHHHPQVQPLPEPAPAAAPAPAAPTGGSSSLDAIQGLVKQLEGAANTMAIPAHQNW